MRTTTLLRLTATALAVVAAVAVADVARPAGEVPRPAGALTINQIWTHTLPDAGNPIGLSSPNVANLAGGPAAVVGDRAGNVYAYSLANGATVPGWPYNSGGVPIDSTPSVAAINAGGLDSVFVGVGNAAVPNRGGYLALSPSGTVQWLGSELSLIHI